MRRVAAPIALLLALASFAPADECAVNGIPLFGRVQFVEAFPDLTVQVVDAFPDLRVQMVEAFPDACGEWQEVTSFPDFTVQIVDAFPDLTIQFVDAFPGVPENGGDGGGVWFDNTDDGDDDTVTPAEGGEPESEDDVDAPGVCGG